MKRKYFVASLVGIALLSVTALSAQAYTFNFTNITNNKSGDVNIGKNQLSLDVTYDGTSVSFKFTNAVGSASSIAQVYFDDQDGILSTMSISSSGDVSFSDGADPKNVPGWSTLDPKFSSIFSAGATKQGGVTKNGVSSSSEWLTLTFNIAQGSSFDDIINALNNGSLRVAVHVQGFDSGGSESFINTPIPAAAWLLGSGLVGLVGVRRWRKRG